MIKSPLSAFHPLIRKWFTESIGNPTDIQIKAWPEISAGKHVLVSAPTGSGKTLTAFLWSINQLATGSWQGGRLRVLYISPLKALNNDVQRNLLKPLSELKEVFKKAGEHFPFLQVLTRSGDTPQADRRRMLGRPPEILISTPESLNILVSSKNSRLMLTGVATVILDEIHAVVGTKRGTHLITAVDRLVPLTGEFQRIALSATVKPMEKVADFIGGYEMAGDLHYQKRRVSIVRSEMQKKYAVHICFPEDARERMVDGSWWPALVESFNDAVSRQRSTLFFANSRRMTEKVTRLMNENEPAQLVYSHHGSLSKEIRLAVEQKLKQGELKAIVATNSLELGIDIGSLDQVVLIQTPRSISSGIQRIGRSGHSVGEVSRGNIYPTHGRDFLNAAVIARAIMERDIEEVLPIDCPLDVLAQVILAMTGVEMWDMDELFASLKATYPFHNLSRRQYDLVLEMLSGRYADTRLRELKKRVFVDRIDNTVKAKDGVLFLVYLAGGTIPDRGYFDLRLQETKAKIGELDEEFVWERNIGETFAMGAQAWRIQRITHNDVEAVPAESKPGIIPFWKAEFQNRDFHFSQKIAQFLEYANDKLGEPDFKKELLEKYFMGAPAGDELIAFLKRQKEISKTDLPHRHHLLIEHFDDPLNRADSKQVILHTLWSGRINRPLAMAMAAAWEEKHQFPLEVFSDDDCMLLMLPHEFGAADMLRLVNSANVEAKLRARLEKTGFFGARFRENAGRALLLPKTSFKKRMPLWLNRLRSKKLMNAVMPFEDFPVLLETWRTCLRDEFDIENLKLLLDELASGQIQVSETMTTTASPFAGSLIWQQTNKHMYEDDTPVSGKTSGLSEELLKEVVLSSHLRPRIPDSLIQILEQKLKRTATGYSPGSSADLLDWVKERLLVPYDDWQDLLKAVEHDYGLIAGEILSPLLEKLVWVNLPGAKQSSICSVENLPRVIESLGGSLGGSFGLPLEEIIIRPILRDREVSWRKIEKRMKKQIREKMAESELSPALSDFILQWLSYFGPVQKALLKETTGLGDEILDDAIKILADTQSIILDKFREQQEVTEICERENLEILLRMVRRSRQPGFKTLGLDALPLFLAAFQGVAGQGGSMEDLQDRLEQLFGFPSPAAAWEGYIFPARLESYYLTWLDSLMQSSDLMWFGCGEKKISFAFTGDMELFQAPKEKEASGIEQIIPDSRGKYSFFDITGHSGMDSREATKKLWQLAWKGRATNDTFAVLRKAILNKFVPAAFRDKKHPGRRAQLNRWRSANPLLGNWYVIEPEPNDRDILEQEEILKDRVRQLLRRYGILFRELLARESPLMIWSRIFRTLRLMELSGEILSGHFFEGISGLQFVSHEAFRFLSRPLAEDSIYWMNAADPASLCGIKLDALKNNLPPRVPSTHLVFHGRKSVLVSRRNGRFIDIHTAPDNPLLLRYLSFFKVLLTRQFNPLHYIMVEKINDKAASASEYAKPLKDFGFAEAYKGLELRRVYNA